MPKTPTCNIVILQIKKCRSNRFNNFQSFKRNFGNKDRGQHLCFERGLQSGGRAGVPRPFWEADTCIVEKVIAWRIKAEQ